MTMNNAYKVLRHARLQEKWTATADLAPYGLHSTLIHAMENNNHIIAMNTSQGKAIKLTLEGFKYATQLQEQKEEN